MAPPPWKLVWSAPENSTANRRVIARNLMYRTASGQFKLECILFKRTYYYYYYYRRPIVDLLETHWKPTCLIGDPLETSTCFIRDWHAWSETSTCLIGNLDMLHQRRLICLIGDPSETLTLYIGDQHAWSENNMTDRRPIEDLDMLHQRTACLIRDLSKTSTCFIGDRHAWSETHQRPQHATSETNMPDRRPIKDRHAPMVTDIPHQRLTCLIKNLSETSTCFIGDPSKSNMPHWRPIWNRHAPLETHKRPTCL